MSIPKSVRTTIDVFSILALSFVAQATHFSYQQGRAVVCGDSAQYVAEAEALLTPDKSPHFEMRKPGYVLFLAGVSLLFGNMGYAAIASNHVLLALLPLTAYGLGVHLFGRGLGWAAAVVAIVKLQSVVYGNRMMSEALFTCLFSFGLLLFVVGLSRRRTAHWMGAAGSLLGLAWLTRAAATPVILAALLTLCWVWRHDRRRLLVSGACLTGPLLGCVLFECSLNRLYAGAFRPANGTVGATLLLRARHFEGFDWPDTADAERVLALLPERSRDRAYVANLLDVWVARYRAIHELGMDEWTYDDLMRRVGLDMLRENAPSYVQSSARMVLWHLLRRPDGQALSPIDPRRRSNPLIHPAARDDQEGTVYWFAYWGLPHRTLQESVALVDRMKAAAAQRAPLCGSTIWKALRYWKSKPAAEMILHGLSGVGRLWPGFALLGCWWLGLNRRTCGLLAAGYVAEALFIGFLTPTTARLQFVWFTSDVTLAAAVPVGVLGVVTALMRQKSPIRGRVPHPFR